MYIYLHKDENGHIRGFQSHIKKPETWPEANLRTIADIDYLPLLLFLTGREHVIETDFFPTARFGDLSLRDDGDHVRQHSKHTKEVLENQEKLNHSLIQ